MRRGVLISFLLIGSVASGQETVTNQLPFEAILSASGNYGPADGFLQTPVGGKPGTSSFHRPTFHELNINDTAFLDAGVLFRWHQLGFLGGYQLIRFDESGTLGEGLISHGSTFPAGDSFKTRDRFDWFRAGAGWQFDLLDHRLALFPKVEMAFLDFSYKLSGQTSAADRAYIKGSVRLGVQATYHLNQRWSLDLDGAAAIPISNTPQVADVLSTLHFELFRAPHVFKPNIFLGAGWERIDYEDNQPLPNHVRAELGPFVRAGLAASF
jgi:hypothetical protein